MTCQAHTAVHQVYTAGRLGGDSPGGPGHLLTVGAPCEQAEGGTMARLKGMWPPESLRHQRPLSPLDSPLSAGFLLESFICEDALHGVCGPQGNTGEEEGRAGLLYL